jgi:glycosyltransferase involved in cell wall biosynthesis
MNRNGSPRATVGPSADVAVVAEDPWVLGGLRSHALAFWRSLSELQREPHLFYLSRTRSVSGLRRALALRSREEAYPPLAGTTYPCFFRGLPAPNHLLGAARIAASIRSSRSIWVLATAGHHGYGAVLSRRPYACWLGTGLTEEWEARRRHTSRSRRIAFALNGPLLQRLEREVIRNAAFVFATSPTSRRAVAAAGALPLEAVKILPIPIEATTFAPEPDDVWGRRLERPTIVFLGRADDSRKNVGLLIDAFRSLRSRLPDARLRMIGRPPPRAVQARIGDGVEVLGEVASVTKVLRTGSLFVLPSLQEGFGIAVAEALASGVPAVVTPCGGPETLVRNSGGGVVLTSFAVEELVETMTALLTDETRLAVMRARGRDFVVREHAPAQVRKRLAATLAELDSLC